MKKRGFIGMALVALAAIAATGLVWADEAAQPAAPAQAAAPVMQTHCPIMGGVIDVTAFTDFEGKRVYFCCPGCIGKFNEDPAGYIQKIEAQGITFYKTPKPQVICPVMEEPIDPAIFTDYEGQRIYFCCKPCINQFNKAPQKYLKVLEEQGVTLEKAPAQEQTPEAPPVQGSR